MARMPLLNQLQNSTRFSLFYFLNPLLTGILIAFSAGLFEESTRFIMKLFFLKPAKSDIIEPIVFGLGHGLAEAVMVLLPFLFILPLESLALGFLERFLAILLHMGLSVVVWNGFQLDKRLRYLVLAIVLHGLVNSLIPLLQFSTNPIVLIEGSLLLIDIFMVLYLLRSKKHYRL